MPADLPAMLTAAAGRTAVEPSDVRHQQAELVRAAARLGSRVLSAADDGNAVMSPAGLLCALAMVRAGAGSTTAAELDAVLGLPSAGRDEAMNVLLSLLEEYDGDPGTVDEDNPPYRPVVHLAQGLFVEESEPTGQTYLDTLSRHYGGGIYPVSFIDAERTKEAIDAWTAAHTGGRIRESPAECSPETTLSLLGTVYFAGAWAAPFDPAATADAPFTLRDGTAVPVPMMNLEDMLAYAQGPFGQAVDLTYGEGFVMRLVLPAQAGPPQVEQDEWEHIAAVLEAGTMRRIALALPRWDHTSVLDLYELLPRLGLVDTFGARPDLDAIQRRLKITSAAQAANITVGEKGTVAAAVTQFDFMATGAPLREEPLELVFDRPFLYQLLHGESGLPLFLGRVVDPRATSTKG